MAHSQHKTRDLCPRCRYTFLIHMHCTKQTCSYHLQVCPECDKQDVAVRVLDDHMEDCGLPPTAPFIRVEVEAAA